ncbi:carbohydrate ABC transporter substrate-binding protein, CUT1 family [Butyrivibrio fibrisolvens]|uniref:Carbohydrate ABC transporter substrate-binding protein, CUT1 family n=1 Tax=Butyrivibrio fibrisolvens TaxID=831 RepID=A0A1H9VKB9_BUTFI|nr:sugar ABC transporter substrate-binding protein [Butyrivibrio fibrisolvens]SES21951.1 carbohydrate ABC transporter substrate-binding protein, CUT1 family [Butyrivibrio fibrisolvens]
MKRKVISVLMQLSMLATLLSGCGSANPDTAQTEAPVETVTESSSVGETSSETNVDATKAGNPITITYANFNASGGNEATLDSMYQAFHEQNPDITVEIETIAMDDYFTTLQTRIAGGTAPDCFEMNIENFVAYASKGILAELSDVDTSALNKTALSAFSYDGKQYALPENFSTVILVYNKDLFDQAGIDYPTSTWTREDVDKAAEAIRALGDNIYGIYQPVTYNEFYKVAAQYGGRLVSEDGKSFTINSEENIKALQSMVDRVQKTNVQPTEEQMGGMGDWDLFESGRLGMIPTGTWCFNTFTDACDFSWDICVEPGQTQKATHFFANSLVVNNDASEEAKLAAQKWISFLSSSDEAAKIRLEAGWDLPALSDMDALSSYLEITPPENRTAVFESLDSLVLPPIITDYSQMSDIISNAVSKAASGESSAEDALNEAQKLCEEQITLQ